jgi:hypothetical protein
MRLISDAAKGRRLVASGHRHDDLLSRLFKVYVGNLARAFNGCGSFPEQRVGMGTMADGSGLARLAPGDLSVQRGNAGLQLLHRQWIEVFAQHLAERFGGAWVFGIVHMGKC